LNPVKRVQLSVYRVQAQLRFDNAFLSNNNNGNSNGKNSNQTHHPQQEEAQMNVMDGLMIQLQQTRQQLKAGIALFNQTTRALQMHTDSQFSLVNQNISRVAIQPTRMATPQQIRQATNINNVELAIEVVQNISQLSKGPKNLYELWLEWEIGFAGLNQQKSSP
jgi:hypothetical protein